MNKLIVSLILTTTVLPRPAHADVPKPGAQALAQALQPFVDDQQLRGIVTVVADGNRVLDLTAVGYANAETKEPMKEDTLFWIASMSKALTASAVMVLVDEGKLSLSDPVEKYIPEFKGQRVISSVTPEQTVLVPAVHPITLADCLSHTAGLPFKSLIEQPTLDMIPLATAVLSHAAAPLAHQPDSKYMYSNAGINIAGRVIEVVSGQSYHDFLRDRIFLPLGMKETTCFPSAEQVARLAESYKPTADKSGLEPTPIGQLHYPLTEPRREPMPGGGFFSTAGDVTRFCQMLLNKGMHQGKRILSEAAVAALSSKQTPENVAEAYGLGLKLNPDGSYGHGGAQGTNMTIDPANGLVLVYMVQTVGQRTDKAKKAQPAFRAAAVKKFGKQ